MARYPGEPYRSGGAAAGNDPGLSNGSGLGPPALGFLAPPPPAAPLPPPPIAPAVGAGGAGGAAVRIAIGAFRGGPNPGAILGYAAAGALLGYVGYEVSSWDWTPKVMWMPPGFRKTGWITPGCSTYDNGRSQPWDNWVEWSSGFDLLGPGADCAPPQVDAGHPWGTGFVDPGTTKIAISRNHDTLPSRCVLWEQWDRLVPGVGVPAPTETPWPEGVPDGLPWLDPAVVPINVPVPATKPPPFRWATPRPGEMPGAPSPAKWPKVVVPPQTAPPVVQTPPRIGTRPVVGPTIVIDPLKPPSEAPETSTPPGSVPPPGSRAPPTGDEIDHKKLNVKNVVSPGVHLVLNRITEGLDAVREIYKGVPKKCRKAAGVHSNRPSVAEKMKAIAHCHGEIDWAVAFANLVNNEVEDWFYGTLGRQTGKATRRLNITTGLSRATRFASQQANPEGEELPILPTLDYDNGQWTLEWMGQVIKDPFGRNVAGELRNEVLGAKFRGGG